MKSLGVTIPEGNSEVKNYALMNLAGTFIQMRRTNDPTGGAAAEELVECKSLFVRLTEEATSLKDRLMRCTNGEVGIEVE